MTLCSIIVPVYNKAHLTRQCLDRLLGSPAPSCPFEVIVVDDASRDSTPRLLASYGDRVRVVTHSANKAFATSCNDGAAVARGDYLLFLNNDTVPLPGWLDALLDCAREHPAAGVIGAKLLFPNGTVQHAGLAICQDRQPRHIYVGLAGDHPAVNKPRRMQAVTGACLLIPRDLFTQTGGFDPVFVNGYEDVDLCLRVAALGRQIRYCPESTLIHLEGVSEGRFKLEAHSARMFHQRWGSSLVPDDLQYYLADGMLRFEYYANYLELSLSPEVGMVQGTDGVVGADRVLAARAKQVYSLLRENVALLAGNGAASAVP